MQWLAVSQTLSSLSATPLKMSRRRNGPSSPPPPPMPPSPLLSEGGESSSRSPHSEQWLPLPLQSSLPCAHPWRIRHRRDRMTDPVHAAPPRWLDEEGGRPPSPWSRRGRRPTTAARRSPGLSRDRIRRPRRSLGHPAVGSATHAGQCGSMEVARRGRRSSTIAAQLKRKEANHRRLRPSRGRPVVEFAARNSRWQRRREGMGKLEAVAAAAVAARGDDDGVERPRRRWRRGGAGGAKGRGRRRRPRRLEGRGRIGGGGVGSGG